MVFVEQSGWALGPGPWERTTWSKAKRAQCGGGGGLGHREKAYVSRSLRRAVRSPLPQLCGEEEGVRGCTSLSLGPLLTCLREGGREHGRELENFSGPQTARNTASSLLLPSWKARSCEESRFSGFLWALLSSPHLHLLSWLQKF